MHQPNYISDYQEASFSPHDRRFTCAQSGYRFQETEMVYVELFCDWVAITHKDEYLLEKKELVLLSEFLEINEKINKQL